MLFKLENDTSFFTATSLITALEIRIPDNISKKAQKYNNNFDLIVDKWEGSQPGYFNFEQVWMSYQYYFDEITRKKGYQSDLI